MSCMFLNLVLVLVVNSIEFEFEVFHVLEDQVVLYEEQLRWKKVSLYILYLGFLFLLVPISVAFRDPLEIMF